MKIYADQIRVCFVSLFIIGAAMAASARSADVVVSSPTAAAPKPVVPNFAEVMRTAYLALVKQSIVPADPRLVATAALEALR